MIKFNEVTWYSKLAALILFLIIIPGLSFCAGIQYEKIQEASDIIIEPYTQQPIIREAKKEPQEVTVIAQLVLTAMKDKDYEALETLTSSKGLSVNSFPSLDLTKTTLSKSDVSGIATDTKKHLFGYSDGSGEPINITTSDYFTTYLYNHDYLNADEVAINKTLGGGNSVNSIIKDSQDRTVVAYHFKGFDPKIQGMDWTTLYLVFDLENGEYKLRAVAKDNWTI